MTETDFRAYIETTTSPVLGDGAMGTMLNARGVGFDQCFDLINLIQPALIEEIHRAYIEAGAQVIQTNTFGANRYKLAAHGLQDDLSEINRAGVEAARRAAQTSTQTVWVAGDVGPLGVRLAPFGRVQPAQAREVFSEQIEALVAAGVDLLIFETMSDLHEIRQAVAAAKEVCDLPLVASMTFTRDDRTYWGTHPKRSPRASRRAVQT
jgi:homocysteine S-methyltransferase